MQLESFGTRSSQVRTSKEFCTPQFQALFPSIAAIVLVATLLAHPRTSRADTIYVSNYGNPITSGQTYTILKFDSTTGTNLGVFGSTVLNEPTGLAFDGSGNLYVANNGNNTIVKFNSSGGILSTNSSVFANTGLDLPQGLAFDSAGNLYVANQHGGTGLGVGIGSVEEFTPGGIGSVFASDYLGENNPPFGYPKRHSL